MALRVSAEVAALQFHSPLLHQLVILSNSLISSAIATTTLILSSSDFEHGCFVHKQRFQHTLKLFSVLIMNIFISFGVSEPQLQNLLFHPSRPLIHILSSLSHCHRNTCYEFTCKVELLTPISLLFLNYFLFFLLLFYLFVPRNIYTFIFFSQ